MYVGYYVQRVRYVTVASLHLIQYTTRYHVIMAKLV